MIEIDIGGPRLSIQFLNGCVEKGIITREGAIKLWEEMK